MDTRKIAWQGWVKLQRSINTNAPKPQMLIYNYDRSLEAEDDLPDDLARQMGEHLRIYVKAVLYKGGGLELDLATTQYDSPWASDPSSTRN